MFELSHIDIIWKVSKKTTKYGDCIVGKKMFFDNYEGLKGWDKNDYVQCDLEAQIMSN